MMIRFMIEKDLIDRLWIEQIGISCIALSSSNEKWLLFHCLPFEA